MKLVVALALVPFASCAAVSSAPSPSSRADGDGERHANTVTVYLGQRTLTDDDWEPLED